MTGIATCAARWEPLKGLVGFERKARGIQAPGVPRLVCFSPHQGDFVVEQTTCKCVCFFGGVVLAWAMLFFSFDAHLTGIDPGSGFMFGPIGRRQTPSLFRVALGWREAPGFEVAIPLQSLGPCHFYPFWGRETPYQNRLQERIGAWSRFFLGF